MGWEGGAIEITATSLSPAERGNWPEFLRSMVMMERRPGVKPTKGFFNGPGTAVLETGLVELKGRMSRRARKGGTGVPPDAWDEDGEGGGLPPAFCGGSLPEGILFGGHRTQVGDGERTREGAADGRILRCFCRKEGDIRSRLGCPCLRL